DLARSAAFYSFVLEALGFKRFGHPAEHASWSNGKFSITLRPAAPELAGVSTRRGVSRVWNRLLRRFLRRSRRSEAGSGSLPLGLLEASSDGGHDARPRQE